ncbi:MAG: hypothetical protein N3I35_06660 [Clostridia bacterium]|nr:hypothetical protein [Clostridia bacterium]
MDNIVDRYNYLINKGLTSEKALKRLFAEYNLHLVNKARCIGYDDVIAFLLRHEERELLEPKEE